MSIIAMKKIQGEVQERMNAVLTVSQMESLMTCLEDVLSGYDISIIQTDEPGHDYALEAYLDAMRVEGRSEKTLRRYRYVLGRLFGACGTNTRSITVYHIRKFFADEKARGIAESTLRSFQEVFNAYFGWCLREGLIAKTPMANIGAIKCQKKVRKAFSEVEIEKLKMHCRSKRDKAIVCFLEATGCRVSEMVGLDRDDINLRKMECTVLGKGNKQRTVYLDPVACMTIQEYLAERSDDNPALFIGTNGVRLMQDGVRKMLIRVGKSAGVEHVHPHKFRRTRATTLIRRGMTIQEVASILGHEKIDTTMKYIVLDQSQIRSSYERYA